MSQLTPHLVRVKTVYRRMLKEHLNWCVDRRDFVASALRVRYSFDRNAGLTDLGAIEAALVEGEQWLKDFKHPDPYNSIHNQGGSSFQRNAAVPLAHLDPPKE